MDDPVAQLKAGLDADEDNARRRGIIEVPMPNGYTGLPRHLQVFLPDPVRARVLREVAAKREILDFTLRRPHFWNPGDEYYSCSQAEDDVGGGPGSGCSDPDRQGDPCDCGRDASVEHVVRVLTAVYGVDDT